MLAWGSLQAQYANDWIDYNQQYFKIKVAEDGLYRVTASELEAAGVPVATIDIGRYQLFRKGKEQAIRVVDDEVVALRDGLLNYLEFYGKRNDGNSDTELYRVPEAQMHTYYNLFSDSSSYFLTWKLIPEPVKRMSFSSDNNSSGLTPQPYHLKEELQLQTDQYKTGLRYGVSADILTAEYDYGEGWASTDIGKNGSRSFSFILTGTDQADPVPTLEVQLVGINNLEHLVDISVGPDESNLRSIGQASFEKQYSSTFTSDLAWSDVGPNGDLVIKVTALGLNGQAERVAVTYVKLTYPQNPSFDDARDQFFYHFPADIASTGYAVLSSTVASGTRVFDITSPESPVSIATTNLSDRLEYVYPNAATDRNFLIVRAPKTVGSIQSTLMENWDIAQKEFIILSTPELDAEVDGVLPVTEYVNYRESTLGGAYEVMLVDIDQLFNQFGYGDSTPLAVRNFVAYALGIGNPQYLFIIGKGTTPNVNYYRKDPSSLIHYVPTFGYPGSDVLFSANVMGGNLDEALPTGRLNAYDARDVKSYLDKVREMEGLNYDELWRKDLVQLSGGQTLAERTSFANHINTFKVKAEGDFLGGRAFNINKKTNDEVQLINITEQVNTGVGFVTFFGHSTGQLTDIEIGRVSPGNNIFGYANPGKYPMFLVNGCNAGEIFRQSDGTPANLTLGEDWVLTPELGAIGFIANSDFALSSSLKRYSDLFYTEAFNVDASFGRSVGAILKSVGTRYFEAYGTDELDRAQVYQTVLQGDPTIQPFGAQAPDYELRSEAIFASGFDQQKVLANVDSFNLNLVIRNYGRSVSDSFNIEVIRTLGDGNQKTYSQRFRRVLRHDTLSFVIQNDPLEVNAGTNVFSIRIDPENQLSELNKVNNSGSLELFIPKGNTINLYPIQFATLDDPEVRFIWQSANLLEGPRDYTIESDTSSGFDSPQLSSQTITGQAVLSLAQDFSGLDDSTTVYWRTRYAIAGPGEDTSWVNGSFTVVPNGTGWGQVGRSQFQSTVNTGLTYDAQLKSWSFQETFTPVEIINHGVNNSNEYTDYLVLIDGINYLATSNTIDPECKKKNAINAVVFGRENAQPYSPFLGNQIDVFNDLICGRRPQVINNFSESEVLGPNRYLDSLISIMATGDMILLFSFDSVAYSNWDAQLLSALGEVGIQSASISGLTDGQPVIFLGRKGDAPGTALEVIDNGSGVPLTEQALQLVSSVTGQFTSGSILSPRIGPAKTWESFNYNLESNANDIFNFDVVGFDEEGFEEVLFTDSRVTDLDISQLDASQYPFLQLELSFSDEIDLTPPQLKSWGLNYELPPEGLLIGDNETIQVQEGQDLSKSFYFHSISPTSFSDSITVNYTVNNVSSGSLYTDQFKIAAPDSGDSTAFTTVVDTRNKVGQNNLFIRLTAQEQEQYLSNNLLNIVNALNVSADETNPVLDVTFDGNYILDGDIISPNPMIMIRFKDENQYLYKQDTTGILVEMKSPCEGCVYERVDFTDPKINFQPASEETDFRITYQPGPLADGTYRLRVQGEDESGNASGRFPYEVSYEVINESTITHFYPYPNPFSTSTRFVFTLTGNSIPEEIKIQIMTVSGRVVREITQDEIGPLKIGNNITQYAWDGRDEYGDILASGVYLYKVFIRQDGESIKHRNTVADRAFKNGFGKLYILR